MLRVLLGSRQHKQVAVGAWQRHHVAGGPGSRQEPTRALPRLQAHLLAAGTYLAQLVFNRTMTLCVVCCENCHLTGKVWYVHASIICF